MTEGSGNCLTKGADLQWQGWLASVAFHAAIVTLVLVAPFHHVIDATTPFQWDVRLVDQDIPSPRIVEADEVGNGSPDKRSRELQNEPTPQSIASAKTVNRPSTSVPRPVEAARPVQRQTQLRKIVTREELPVQEVVTQSANRQMIEAGSSAMAAEAVRSEPVTKDSVEHVAIERSEERQQYEVKRSEIRDAHMADPQPSRLETVSAGTAAVMSSGAVLHEAAITELNVVQRLAEMRSPSVLKSADSPLPKSEAAERPDEATAGIQSATEGTAAQTEEGSRSKPAASEMVSVGSSETQRDPTAAASASGSGKGTGPDYGWLKRLLWERINRIKSYSEDAVENEWEGRVVMVVTVQSDGRIEEVNVIESSGNGSLDREAATLIERVTPLELDRALGAARVKLRVPISFGLE